jgi:Fe-S cluster assembly ATP-binding protein
MNTSQPLLQVQDLRVTIGEREVLQSVSFAMRPGTVAVLMGANGSGKSTLGLALAGHPRYRVTGGTARFAGQDLLAMNVEQRARAGLFLSFQAPPDIPGVKNNLYIRTAVNSVRESRGEAPLDAFDFLGEARGAAKQLGLPEAMLGRPVNDLLQLALLRPRLAILDEIDSGMDVDGVRAALELVASLRATGTSFLVVSHYLQLIESLTPDAVLRLEDGRIAESGGLELAREIARSGYARSPEAVEA